MFIYQESKINKQVNKDKHHTRHKIYKDSFYLIFCLLLWSSLQSLLAIWHFLCCALNIARLFSAAAWFWLKIASSGRGALAGHGGRISNAATRMHQGQI
jgi:hypothetical protein